MITIEEKRTAARGAGLRQNEQNDFEENSDHSVNFVQKLEWRRHGHKKIVIITSAITNLPIIPPRFPNKLPQPARPASIILLPATNSPRIAPITGATNKPMIPKEMPMSAPRTAPNIPHFVAPKYLAPK